MSGADSLKPPIEPAAAEGFDAGLLASMSHELRTPLNGILGFTEFLIDGKPGPLNEKQREYLQDVHTSAQQLLQLINDVMDLAKGESAECELKAEAFDPAQAIKEVCAVIKGAANRKGIAIRRDAGESGRVTLDRRLFKRVLYCLLSNAVKFCGSGGKVEISATPGEEGRFHVRVKDSGPGIRAQALPDVFRERDGAGGAHPLGVSLGWAQRIVERQGGGIEVQSEYGRGSTFTVTLPVIPQGRGEP
ncbi:MAG: HAMP domain-containing sensor histidine kinase [Chthoniobacteraceae bacterium]|jgi:signal transduction histidine kinase